MKVTKRVFFCLLVFSFLAPVLLLAQGEKPKIAEIKIVGNKRISTETMLYYISSRVGGPYDEERLARDFEALFRTGFFEDLRILAQDGAQGKIVIFEVKEKKEIAEIQYKGLKSISEPDISEKLEELNITLRPGISLDIPIIYRVMDVIKELLKEKGRRFARVNYQLESISSSTVRLIFDVDEGDKLRIGGIDFVGNRCFSDWELKRTMKNTREHWSFSFLSSHDIYKEEQFQDDLNRLRQLYWSNGYMAFKVDEPKLEIKEDNKGKGKNRLFITIPIEEGEQYQVGEVKVSGNKMLPADFITLVLKLKKGEVFNNKDLWEGLKDLQELYGNRGYIMINILPRYNFDEEKKRINLDIEVQENDIYYVNRIEFEGNINTHDKVLRRQMMLQEGQVFSQQRLKLSVDLIKQLGYFDVAEPSWEVNKEDKAVDLKMKLNEMGRNSIMFGGGYSEFEGAFGNFSFQTKNLFGRGITLGFSGQLGKRATYFNLSYYDPWVFDRHLGLGIGVFKRRISFIDFHQNSVGVNFRFSWPFNRFTSGFLTYQYEIIDIKNPDPDNPYYTSLFMTPTLFPEGKTVTSSITPSITWNTVDHPLFPTHGNRLTVSVELAGGPLRGERNFVRFFGEYVRHFHLFPRQIFSFRSQIGYAKTFSGQSLLIYERYFLGGEYTIRGLRLRSVSPINEQGYYIGGNKMLLFNFEYVFLITPQTRLAIFFDAGNAFDNDQPYSLTNLRRTTGAEFKVFVPFLQVPMRFIWAINLSPIGNEPRSIFTFGVGTMF
jgi:outer membrane protein insertion porin family